MAFEPGIIIQARSLSTRFPRKIFQPLGETSVLGETVRRCLETKLPVVVAVPWYDVNSVRRHLDSYGFDRADVDVMVGVGIHPDDVLARIHEAAVDHGIDPVIRITSDCPVIQPWMITEMLRFYQASEWDYYSNCHPIRFVPVGWDIEIMRLKALGKANREATDPYDREHVTSCFYRDDFCVGYKCGQYHIAMKEVERRGIEHIQRMTVDTPEDLEALREWL